MDNILLFHTDLKNFAAKDLQLLGKYYGIDASPTDLSWLIAIKHSEKKAFMPAKTLGELRESLESLQQKLADLGIHYTLEKLNLNETMAIANSGLDDVPTELQDRHNLRSLNLEGNRMKAPIELGRLTNLTSLSLENNQLTAVPIEICNLTNLEDLTLSRNSLTTLPDCVFNFSKLENLDLAGNDLEELSPKIGELINLRFLHIDNNKLINVPTELGNLYKLKNLDFSNNNLTDIPLELGDLSKLEHLNLSNNNLTRIPLELHKLTNLTYLNLRGNPITTTSILRAQIYRPPLLNRKLEKMTRLYKLLTFAGRPEGLGLGPIELEAIKETWPKQ